MGQAAAPGMPGVQSGPPSSPSPPPARAYGAAKSACHMPPPAAGCTPPPPAVSMGGRPPPEPETAQSPKDVCIAPSPGTTRMQPGARSATPAGVANHPGNGVDEEDVKSALLRGGDRVRAVARQVVRQRGLGDGKRGGDRDGGYGSRPGPSPGGERPAAAPVSTQLANRAAVNLIRVRKIGPAPGRSGKVRPARPHAAGFGAKSKEAKGGGGR